MLFKILIVYTFSENPLTCNCETQNLWRWMQDHNKIILRGSKNLRCEHPEELHGYPFLELPLRKLCDIPVIIRIAIQDIQTYSVLVSWQSRNQSGLNGYQVAYFREQMPNIVSTVPANLMSRIFHLKQKFDKTFISKLHRYDHIL